MKSESVGPTQLFSTNLCRRRSQRIRNKNQKSIAFRKKQKKTLKIKFKEEVIIQHITPKFNKNEIDLNPKRAINKSKPKNKIKDFCTTFIVKKPQFAIEIPDESNQTKIKLKKISNSEIKPKFDHNLSKNEKNEKTDKNNNLIFKIKKTKEKSFKLSLDTNLFTPLYKNENSNNLKKKESSYFNKLFDYSPKASSNSKPKNSLESKIDILFPEYLKNIENIKIEKNDNKIENNSFLDLMKIKKFDDFIYKKSIDTKKNLNSNKAQEIFREIIKYNNEDNNSSNNNYDTLIMINNKNQKEKIPIKTIDIVNPSEDRLQKALNLPKLQKLRNKLLRGISFSGVDPQNDYKIVKLQHEMSKQEKKPHFIRT